MTAPAFQPVTQLVPPAEYPVTREEAKRYARIGTTGDAAADAQQDAEVDRLIAAAYDLAEREQWRAIMPQTLRASLAEWPAFPLQLPRPPLIVVEEVAYRDPNLGWQILDASDYVADAAGDRRGSISLADGVTLPSIGVHPDAVRITWRAGYASSLAVPESTRHGILAAVRWWFDHRDGSDLPDGIYTQLRRYALREFV